MSTNEKDSLDSAIELLQELASSEENIVNQWILIKASSVLQERRVKVKGSRFTTTQGLFIAIIDKLNLHHYLTDKASFVKAGSETAYEYWLSQYNSSSQDMKNKMIEEIRAKGTI